MDSPFYGRRYWNLPSRSRPRSHDAPSLREIPVQYVGSEEKRPSRSDSAATIQKVFRGFLVRKSVKKIKEIRSEVEEIEKRISKEETIDLIAKDSQERLKLNEMLMRLLFKLDSVRGVDSAVRDCRKAVIRKAIALQEFLDAAFSSNNNKDDQIQNGENVGEVVDDQNQAAQVECTDQNSERTEALNEKETVENRNGEGEAQEVVEPYLSDGDGLGESVGTSQADSSANTEEDENSSPPKEEDDVKQSGALGTREENTKNKELLLKRMMEDNERMMEMMAQLLERNEMQMALLDSLSQRVERLERAFMCERLRRKKKRNAAGTVFGCETSPDNKKCGKR